MSFRAGLVIASVWIWGAIALGLSENYLATRYAMAVALVVGMAAALIISRCAEYDAERSRRRQL